LRRTALLLPLVLLVAACAAPAPRSVPVDERRAAYDERADTLAAWDRWTLTGRLGVDAGEDGGSGRLDWDNEGAQRSLRFRGALGQGAWRLDIAPGDVRLQRANGSVTRATSVEELVLRETGWRLPVESLAWWVRGLATPDGPAPELLELNLDGTPALLDQRGWRVAYTRYENRQGVQLPTRLEAVRDEVRVKLAISRWRGETPPEGGDG